MLRMPPEWARHERTLLAWPCRRSLWGDVLDRAKAEHAGVANAVAAFEPVTVVCASEADAAEARAACTGGCEVVVLPIDDSWLRDSGPIVVRDDATGERVARHFRFNAWGEKFHPFDADARIGGLLAEHLGLPVTPVDVVLEGGSVAVDGAGLLLTTEECLLNPNRNPDLGREELEAVLRRELGVTRVLWLGEGLIEDRDTDGHVDLIAAFAAPGKVLLQVVAEEDPNFDRMEENRRRATGWGLEVVEVAWLPRVDVAGEPVAVSYLNLYVCNGGVVVPLSGVREDDERAVAQIASAFPDHEVVGVDGVALAYGGGGPHCITQQVPDSAA